MKWAIPLLESSISQEHFFFFNVDKRSVISETTILASDDHMRDRFTIEKKASDLQETHTTEGMSGSLYFQDLPQALSSKR